MTTRDQLLGHAIQAHRAGKVDEAVSLYKTYIGQHSEDPRGLLGLGSLWIERQEYAMAIVCLSAAAEFSDDPELTDQIWNNLGVALKWEGRSKQAIQCFEKSLELLAEHEKVGTISPEELTKRWRSVKNNMGSMFINAGKPRMAEHWFSQALEHVPDDPQAQWNLGLALLEQGRWAEGFDLYEYGIIKGDRKDRTYWMQDNTPFWQGQKTGTLVIYGEQGIGDEILFMGAADEAMTLADHVIIDCTPRMETTMRRSFPWAEVHSSDTVDVPQWALHRKIDHKVLMGGLFKLFRRDNAALKRTQRRYMETSFALVRRYKERLAQLPGRLNVAVMWRGGTRMTNQRDRSIPLDLWKPLLACDANFISLQYGQGAIEEAVRSNVHHWQEVVDDIDAQFAMIDACDLVITCCGTLAHIAGSLGKECWVLGPQAIRWCYGLEGERMPFYESVRIIRQKERGNWVPVIKRAADELKDFGRIQDSQSAVA